MTQAEKRISVSEYEYLIASYPLFCLLSPENIHELALLATEKYIEAGDVITQEGELVDSVYLILSGQAEVTRTVFTSGQKEVMHIATLGPSDAIGLAETGFFSHSGIRTATVTATSSMVLLRIDIESFHKFLQEPSVPYPALKNVGEKILFMNAIRGIELFEHLPNETLHHLATLVKKMSVKANAIIFHEGDLADNCYFILSGRVVISQKSRPLNELETPQMFGEGAFVFGGIREATAQAETDCELLLLEGKEVQKLLSDEVHESKIRSFFHKLRDAIKFRRKKG